MEIWRVWFCCCMLFCIYCVSLLIDESYQITFWADDDTEAEKEKFEYLGCVELTSLDLNRAEIELQELRDIFSGHIRQRLLRVRPNRKQKAFKELILSRTGSAMVIRSKVCIVIENRSELKDFNKDANGTSSEAVSFVFKYDTFDLARMSDSETKFDQLIVRTMGHPYSDCSESKTRFHCLNDCFKRKFRLARYFYDDNETGLIQLIYSDKNRSIVESERKCFAACNRWHCKMLYINQNWALLESQSVFAFRAQPVMSSFNFGIQLASMVCLILNIHFSGLLTIAFEFANSKIRIGKGCLVYVRLFLLFVGLLIGLFLFARMIMDYRDRLMKPSRKETTRNVYKPPDTMQLVVCLPVEVILSNYTKPYRPQIDYRSLTMFQLEKATNGAARYTIDHIVLSYQEKVVKISWGLTSKVLFQSVKESDQTDFFRCFQLAVHPIEPYYQMLLSISKLKIQFKNISPDDGQIKLFLLAENENFNTKSFQYLSNALVKQIELRSRLNGKCVNYSATYPHLKCSNWQDCIERCTGKAFFDFHGNITIGDEFNVFNLTVDKELYSPAEWAVAYPVTTGFPFNAVLARDYCMKRIPKFNSCEGIRFENGVKIRQPEPNTKEINLYHVVYTSIEDEPSWYALALDLLSLQSIFFGLTVFELLKMIKCFVQTKLRMRRNAKVLALIYLASLFGFSYHLHHVIEEIVNGELIHSQHYELVKQVKMPELVFCLQIDKSLIHKHHKMTGNHLEELTSELNARKIFRRISYRNDQNDWVDLESNFTTKIFQIETFYFFFKKW